MEKYLLVCLAVCLSVLSKAQKIDTVAEKISKLEYTKWEIYPSCVGSSIEDYISSNFTRPKDLEKDFSTHSQKAALVYTFKFKLEVD